MLPRVLARAARTARLHLVPPAPLLVSFALTLTLASATRGEDPPTSHELTLERIFASGELSAPGFSVTWIDGSSWAQLESSLDPAGGRDLVLVNATDDTRRVLVSAGELVPPGETTPLEIEDWALSNNEARLLVYTASKRVWRQNSRGDYWLLDRSSRELRKLGGDASPSTLQFARFSPDGEHISYVREGAVWVEHARDGEPRLLTPDDDRGTRIRGTFDWVYEEEFGLRDGTRWSPDSRHIAYWEIDTEGVPEFVMIHQTHTLYPRLTRFAYPKTGQRNPAARVGVVSREGGDTHWIPIPGDARDNYIARVEWLDAERILVEQINRHQNTAKLWVATIEGSEPGSQLRRETADAGYSSRLRTRTPTGREASPIAVTLIHTDRDECWLDLSDEHFVLDGGAAVTRMSERDGWRHVWIVPTDGSDARVATPFPHDVIELLSIDQKDGWLYYIASPDRPTERALFRSRLDGSAFERLGPEEERGTSTVSISPNGRYAVRTRSRFSTPPSVDLVSIPSLEVIRSLSDPSALVEKLTTLELGQTELFRVEIEPGVKIDAWTIEPPGIDRSKKHPVIVYVYGEPAGQTVLDRWGGAGYLFHQLLARRGYVILSFDNRGTPAPRGRAWRKSVYRRVGDLGPRDQAAALAKTLEDRPWLDSDRVGIWGWSGGGSSTLHAMFKFPELYKVGVSIAPVPNQRLYDTIYQERYMGLPDENVAGYRQGSAIHFARQLEGDLLVIHGTADDNCHYQGVEALVDELIRHGKQFSMMAYPNRTHAIREGAGTTLHLRTLMTRFFERHLDRSARERPLAADE